MVGPCSFQAALGNGCEFIGQFIVVLLFPVGCFCMGTLNKKCKPFDLWLFQEWLVAGEDGRHMRRAISFPGFPAVDMVQHCQVFGRSQSLTWELIVQCWLPLGAGALCSALCSSVWSETHQVLLLSPQAARGT